MKLIRYILFIPLCFLAISIVYWAFAQLISWFLGLSIFWLIVVLFLFGSIIWSFFQGISAVLMSFASKIAPNREFGFWTVLVLSIINGIWAIYDSWTLDIKYTGTVIFGAIVFTFLVVELTIALIYGSAMALEDE